MKYYLCIVFVIHISLIAAADAVSLVRKQEGYTLWELKKVFDYHRRQNLDPYPYTIETVLGHPLPPKNSSDQTVLHVLAAVDWSEEAAYHLVKTVLTKCEPGEPPTLLDARDKKNNTALHIAAECSGSFAVALLAAGANPLVYNCNGDSPLHSAARHSDNALIGTLCSCARVKLDIHHPEHLCSYTDVPNAQGETALMCAIGVLDVISFYALCRERVGCGYTIPGEGRTCLGHLFLVFKQEQYRASRQRKYVAADVVEDVITLAQDMLREGCQLSERDTEELKKYTPLDPRIRALLELAAQTPRERAYNPSIDSKSTTVESYMKREIFFGRDTFSAPKNPLFIPRTREDLRKERIRELSRQFPSYEVR